MLTLSVVLAVLATLIGMGLASWAQLADGPVIVLVAAAGFLLSLLLPRGSAAGAPHDAGALD
jgi:ABC-type Mn2+/Zn2+ transport system permease subunit